MTSLIHNSRLITQWEKLKYRCSTKYNIRCRKIITRELNNLMQHKPVHIKKFGKNGVVVSLTTIPERFDYVCIPIMSMLLQCNNFEAIYLYVSNQYTIEDMPESVKQLQNIGLNIRFVNKEGLEPHTKYYYCAHEFGDDKKIITIDDDVFYNLNIIHRLLKANKANPNCICANRVHIMTFDSNNMLLPYNNWSKMYNGGAAKNGSFFFTGVGGVMYPIGFFTKEMLDEEKIKDCIWGDDVYLNFWAVKNRVKIVKDTSYHVDEKLIPDSQKVALAYKNVLENRNDIIIKNCLQVLNITEHQFFRLCMEREEFVGES